MKKPLTFADLTAPERKLLAMCVHEGSHAVLGVVAGGVLRRPSIYGDRITPGSPRDIGPSGLTLFDFVPEGQESAVAFSGPYAEARWLAGRRPNMREVHATFDTTGCRDKALLGGAAMSEASAIVRRSSGAGTQSSRWRSSSIAPAGSTTPRLRGVPRPQRRGERTAPSWRRSVAVPYG